jgi:UDP-glucose 4-epimerase
MLKHIENENVLVTGGMGFIGTAIVKYLSKNNKVTIADRLDFGKSPDIKIDNNKIVLLETDLAKKSDIFNMIKDGRFNSIIHLAALTHIPYCEQYPDFAYSSNVLSTLNIVDSLPEKCKLIVFSTSSTYAPEDKMHDESSSELKPIDFYGLTKKHVEDLMNYYANKKGLQILGVRLANAAGYGETNPKLIGTILQQLSSGQSFVELGNLTPRRDFINIIDISWILSRLLYEWPVSKGKVEYFNIATGHDPVSVKELFDKIVNIYNKDIELRVDESRIRKIDRELLYPNPAKLISLLDDYSPMRVDDWLKEIVADPGLRLDNDIEDKIKNR